MPTCPECEEIMDEDDVEYECPNCGKDDSGEGFYRCESCGTLFDFEGNLWKCENCEDETEDETSFCPCCEAPLDDDRCYECGWPDVNQGWVGENY